MLNKATIWRQASARQLAEALVAIDDLDTMRNFLRDVMTEKEISEVGSRLEAARMLRQGEKYTDIVAKTKLSSRTVARISEWLKDGCGGYASVLNQTADHHGHLLSERVG
jgi:TrpR-related protein YerC/YecD